MESIPLKVRPSSVRETIAAALIVSTVVGLTCLGEFGDDSERWLVLMPVYCFMPCLIVLTLVRALRRRRVGTVLAHIEEAVRLNLPLTDMLRAAANSESMKTRDCLAAVHDNLQVGQPLALALYTAMPEMPAGDARAIAAAGSIGALPQELRRMLKRYLPHEGAASQLDRYYRGYAVLISVFMVGALSLLLCANVIPKYTSIFAAFGMKLPRITIWMIEICSSYTIMGALAAIVVLLCIPWRGAAKDYLIWCIPVAGGAARDQGLSELCAFLTDALEAGRPMDEALLQAEAAQPNAVLRRRVGNWRRGVVAGESVESAARRAGMPSLVVSMLKSAVNGEGTVQVLAFLARHYEYRFSRFREMIRAAAIPAFVTCAGLLVLAVQLSIFQPMLTLIDGLASGGPHRGGF